MCTVLWVAAGHRLAILAPCAHLVSQTARSHPPARLAPDRATLPLSVVALLGVGGLGDFSLLQELFLVLLVSSCGASGERGGGGER